MRALATGLLVLAVALDLSSGLYSNTNIEQSQRNTLTINANDLNGQDVDYTGSHRRKREAPEEFRDLQYVRSAQDLSSAFHLNNSHLHLMVHWPGTGSEILFCLARDPVMQKGATSRY